MAKFLGCSSCGSNGRTVPDDVIELVCWVCSLRKVVTTQITHELELSEVTPEILKKTLKDRGWSYSALATHLGERTSRISKMATGKLVVSEVVYAWVTSQSEGLSS